MKFSQFRPPLLIQLLLISIGSFILSGDIFVSLLSVSIWFLVNNKPRYSETSNLMQNIGIQLLAPGLVFIVFAFSGRYYLGEQLLPAFIVGAIFGIIAGGLILGLRQAFSPLINNQALFLLLTRIVGAVLIITLLVFDMALLWIGSLGMALAILGGLLLIGGRYKRA